MKILKISLSLLFITLFISCKKEEPLIVTKPDGLLLKQIVINDQPVIEYSYSDAKLISEEQGNYDCTINHYNDNNLLESTDYYTNTSIFSNDLQVYQAAMNHKDMFTPDNSNKGASITYEYNSDNLLTKATFSPTTGASQYSEFSYDSEGRVNRQILYWGKNESGYIEYTYDEKGNLIKEILYDLPDTGVAELSTAKEYEFDNQINPYKAISKSMTPGIYTNSNNITKETCTINSKAVEGTDQVLVNLSSYEYNSNGYPISKNGNVKYVYN